MTMSVARRLVGSLEEEKLPEIPNVNVPADLRTYVTQHHGYLTQACRHHDQLGLPLSWDSDGERVVSAKASMELFRLTVATHIHPDVISWWGTHALGCLSIAREFATRKGKEGLNPVLKVIERDVENFGRAQDLFTGMPDDVQQVVRNAAAGDARLVLGLYSPRLMLSLPGTVLLAWQKEWHDALVAFHQVFGGTAPPASSAVDTISARLEENEQETQRLRRQLALAAAALDPGRAPDEDDQ